MTDLIIFNQCFPHGHREESFLGPELPKLREHFNVQMVAYDITDESLEDRSQKLYIVSPINSVGLKLLMVPKMLFSKVFWTEIRHIMRDREKITGRIRDAIMYYIAAQAFYHKVKKKLGVTRNFEGILYFYWFDYRCLGFCLNAHKYPKLKLVARTHGFDLYDYRERYGLQLYKSFMDSRLDRLIFAAQYAKEYYLKRYGYSDGNKYPVHRLGVAKQEVNALSCDLSKRSSTPFTLVSCSNVLAIKRIELIIEGLAAISDSDRYRLNWIHIGDGTESDVIQNKAKQLLANKPYTDFRFVGYLENKAIIDFYRKTEIFAFITTTSTEGGSPVSIMEAMSFGIPVIGTAIGEIPLMIENCGIILSENPEPLEIAEAIQQLIDSAGTWEYRQMCINALNRYNELFNVDVNNESMVRELCGVL